MEDERIDIDLKRFKSHQRRFPWAFIRKAIIVSVILGLFYYIKTEFDKKSTKETIDVSQGIEVDVERL
jgi:hypothetical protein